MTPRNYTKSCLKSIGEKGWGMGDGGWGMGGKQSITGFLKLDRQLITGLKTDLVLFASFLVKPV
jgi:hypothetical protein